MKETILAVKTDCHGVLHVMTRTEGLVPDRYYYNIKTPNPYGRRDRSTKIPGTSSVIRQRFRAIK